METMSGYPVEIRKTSNNNDASNSQRPGPLLAALNEVDRLNDLFNDTPDSSDDIFSEEDCMLARHFSKQEELVSCLLKMKNLMEDAELESMRLKEEKKLLTKRIGESLVTVNTEMDNLKQQLKEQDRRLKELGASPVSFQSLDISKNTSGVSNLVAEQTEQIIALQKKLLAFEQENTELKKQNFVSKMSDDEACRHCKRLQEYAGSLEVKLQKYKDSVTVMRQDRKKLKAEKLELLDQLKQLYATLEDKERELREFILNYEQRMKDSEETVKQLLVEKERVEKERWELLKVATENSERCINLKTELDSAEESLKRKEEELKNTEEELGRYTQSHSNNEEVLEFFGLFGKEISPKKKVDSVTQDTATTTTTSKEECNLQYSDNQGISKDRKSEKRPPDLNIYNSLERSSPILACSTPVPDSSDTQYLSLGSPERPEPYSSHSARSPPPYGHTNRSTENVRDAQSPVSLDEPRNKPTPPVVKRSSSLKRRESPRKSPKLFRNATIASPKTPKDDKSETQLPSNGSVVRRQGSMNRRPRTFHPDIMDISLNEDPTPSSDSVAPSSDLVEPKSPKKKSLTGTLSRMFGKDKEKNSSQDGSKAKTPQEEMFDKWNIWDSIQRVPMALWKARDVIVWLEIECCMPMYVKKCSQYIKSGRVLLQLADQDLTSLLEITNPMHKLKLKLALDDHRYPDRKIVLLSKIDHVWLSYTWLKDLGLSQYSSVFEKNLVDGRMVNTFTKKDLEKQFGMTKKLHQVSFLCGLHLLRKMNFDKDALNIRRANCADADIDMIVWTNERLIQWALSIDLKECAHKLRESGVHGAFIVLDETFTIDTMATALGISTGKNSLYQHLNSELSPLLKSSRSKLSPDDKLKNGKPKHSGLSRSFSLRWSRRDKPKRLSSSRSTGNINGNITSSKESNLSEDKPSRAKGKQQGTLL